MRHVSNYLISNSGASSRSTLNSNRQHISYTLAASKSLQYVILVCLAKGQTWGWPTHCMVFKFFSRMYGRSLLSIMLCELTPDWIVEIWSLGVRDTPHEKRGGAGDTKHLQIEFWNYSGKILTSKWTSIKYLYLKIWVKYWGTWLLNLLSTLLYLSNF